MMLYGFHRVHGTRRLRGERKGSVVDLACSSGSLAFSEGFPWSIDLVLSVVTGQDQHCG